MKEQIAEDMRYALDPVAFAADKLKVTPDPWQAEVMQSSSKRILLNCSRQSGKSTTAAIIALHRAWYYPNSLILLVSPGLRQSQELFKKVQFFFKRLNWEAKLPEDNKLSMMLENGSRILSLPSSEDKIRGFSSVSLIIEDEASRVPDELYRATRPMLAVSKGTHIIMSTPYGKRGHFYEEWIGDGPWELVEIPATKCERISKEFLDEEKTALGDWWYQQEYFCQFMEMTDSLFTYDMITSAFDADVKPLFPAQAGAQLEQNAFLSDDVQPLVMK